MSEQENKHTVSLPLPKGAVVQTAILVVGYFDAEGDTLYGFHDEGDSTLSNQIGLLELAKAHLLVEYGVTG